MSTYTHQIQTPRVVGLRLGRLAVLASLVLVLGGGGGFWLLTRYGHKATPEKPAETVTQPAWMQQPQRYVQEVLLPTPAMAAPPAPPDRSREILEELAKLWKETQGQRDALVSLHEAVETQRKDLDTLKSRLAAPPPPRGPQPATTTPPRKLPPGTMLFITHEPDKTPPPPLRPEYTLAPGATKIPFVLETKIISDVEGVLTGRVSANVYDTATGRHLLIPQGSTVLGNTQSSKLIYGNERLDTITLKLAFPDGRSVDLDRAPITDQEGIAGMGGDVNQHYGRLLAAVLIQGVLRGGATAVSTAAAGATGGQVITGVTATGAQTGSTITGPLLSTRPTITTEAGQLANIILLKELRLPAMWQDGEPHDAVPAKRR